MTNAQRDEEIVGVLIALGASRKEAWLRLTKTRDRPALLRRLKEEQRLENQRFERDQNKARLKVYAEKGRESLRDALEAARSEQRTTRRAMPAFERLFTALRQMDLMESGALRAHQISPSTARSSDHADPTTGEYVAVRVEEWKAVCNRLADVAEHELNLMSGDATVIGGRTSDVRDRRIFAMVGEPVAFIAYVEDVSVKHINDLCREQRALGLNYRVHKRRLVLDDVEEGAA